MADEKTEQLNVQVPIPIVIPESSKIKTSNLEDDKSILLTPTEKIDLTDGGTTILHTHTSSRARAYAGANQTIADSTWTKVKLDTESYDGDSEFDIATNYRFTALVAGYYQVNAVLKWESPAATIQYAIAIYKNGTAYSTVNGVSVNTSVFSQSISDIVYLAATNYIELYAIQTTGGNDVIEGGALNKTYISVHRLS